MSRAELSGKAGKARVRELLKSTDHDRALEELNKFPGPQVLAPLFSFLYGRDEELKWAAVTAIGAIVARIADEDREKARVIVRRLMWNLNDESGGIGWGSPEALGEILARHKGLAEEYAHILLSYAMVEGNYLEHEMLQKGLLWGIGRLSQVRPHLMKEAVPHLIPFLESEDATLRGLSAWIMGILRAEESGSRLRGLKGDENEVRIFLDRRIKRRRVKDLAEKALQEIEKRHGSL